MPRIISLLCLWLASVATLASASSVLLQWDPYQVGELEVAGIYVYRQDNCMGPFVHLPIPQLLPVMVTSYLDTTVEDNHVYCYQVKPIDTAGREGLASNVFQMDVPPLAPAIRNLRGQLQRSP